VILSWRRSKKISGLLAAVLRTMIQYEFLTLLDVVRHYDRFSGERIAFHRIGRVQEGPRSGLGGEVSNQVMSTVLRSSVQAQYMSSGRRR
jgi:hypothetical protein